MINIYLTYTDNTYLLVGEISCKNKFLQYQRTLEFYVGSRFFKESFELFENATLLHSQFH